MKKKYTLWGIGAVILALLALILFPPGQDLDKYTHLYEQGLYTDVCEGLARELERNPDWSEGRELLLQAALAQGRLDLALVQLAELKGAGWDTPRLELQVNSWLANNKLDLEHADSAVQAARHNVDITSSWDWSTVFYLRLLTQLERTAEIPAALELFVAKHSPVQSYIPDLYSVLAEAWSLMAETSGAQTLWQASVLLEEKVPAQSWRQLAASAIAYAGGLEKLWADNPEDAVLTAYLAETKPSGDALRFLRDWEQKYSVPPAEARLYSSFKSRVISAAEALQPEDLNWVDSDQLIQAASASVANPGKCRIVLDRLEDEGNWSEEIAIIRAALAGPSPSLNLPGTKPVISPDGKWAVAWRETNWALYNLITGAEIPLSSQSEHTAWAWAPDSSKIAGAGWVEQTPITIYSTQGKILSNIELSEEHFLPVGWNCSDTLWVQPVISASPLASMFRLDWMGQPLLCDVEAGEVYAHEVVQWSEIVFFPGPKGFLAWQRPGKGPSMQRGEDTHEYPLRSMGIESWVPDGSGIILSRSTGLSLWKGDEPESLGVMGHFLGWRSKDVFYWSAPMPGEPYVPVSSSDYLYPHESQEYVSSFTGRLMTYNIRTGVTEELDVLGNLAAAAGKTVLISVNGQIIVYIFP